MAATDVNLTRGTTASEPAGRARRWVTETKSSLKTTELYVYVATFAGILIAGAVTKAGGGHDDRFIARDVWLYATILTVGYLLSRGLAKSGSPERYDGDENIR